ncbi:protein SDA1 homolog [Eucalyptus grandis]|uniref:protein SDA1 homolog n=1 Tax=Eucalyptus grandis TaxID=71139 RepID=UPI00192EA000|nr:protein SDA1 homolog [Eucalyptus grandis]
MSSARLSLEALSASGRSSEKLSLAALQSKMKCDPEGYATELGLVRSQFESSLELFEQQAALSFASISGVAADPAVAKDLGDRASFLAHVAPFYPKQLAEFPARLAEFLRSSARSLPSGLRCTVTQALILLVNRKMVDIRDTLALFVELQTLGDRALRKLAFSHVVHSIRKMNQKHKNEATNRSLQNVLFSLLQQEEETKAKQSLIILCELHRRKVWFDDRTANAICTACFHPASRIMIATLSFLLDYEKIEDDSDSDASSSDDELSHQSPHVIVSKEAAYKAHHKGTSASKKKKKAKLQRAMRSMKRQQRLSSEKSSSNYYSPLNHLKDAQGFAEKLFSRLQTCNERFEVKMMMLKVVARTVGLHHLILLNFYPFLQKYVQPHQRDVTTLLAAAVQACHDMVPPDAVEPLFKQIVNQFVHDRSRPEAIAVGINVVREICLRMPLLMNEDLLQDLVLYKKSHEKAISAAARSLISLFRELCPSMLVKKDRGRPSDPTARPKAYGEVSVASDVPGVELLQNSDDDEDDDNIGSDEEDIDTEDSDDGGSVGIDISVSCGSDDDNATSDDEETHASADDNECDDESLEGDSEHEEDNSSAEDLDEVSSDELDEDEDEHDDEDAKADCGDDNEEVHDEGNAVSETNSGEEKTGSGVKFSETRKRKFSDLDGQINAAETSLRALKKLAETKLSQPSSDSADGILSNEDFRRIKQLKAKKEAKAALTKHGLLGKGVETKSPFKVPSSDQLSFKRVDPAKLEAHVKQKLSKEERLALVKAGREERGKYQARAAIKQKKTGGSSNKQKEHRKVMPMAAKRAKVQRSRQDKKKKQGRLGKQFRGKKAWK